MSAWIRIGFAVVIGVVTLIWGIAYWADIGFSVHWNSLNGLYGRKNPLDKDSPIFVIGLGVAFLLYAAIEIYIIHTRRKNGA